MTTINLKEVSAILNAKAPQDAPAFKVWLQTVKPERGRATVNEFDLAQPPEH